MRILRWVAGIAVAVIVVVGFLDTFGGFLFDGPLGPIPGGAFQGDVNSDPNPDWSNLEEVIELEIRPDNPWSLSVWNVVVDGEVYVPSAMGASRRWTAIVLEEPLARMRTGGEIYEARIERVTDPALQLRVAGAVAERYGMAAPKNEEDTTAWYFHLTTRAQG